MIFRLLNRGRNPKKGNDNNTLPMSYMSSPNKTAANPYVRRQSSSSFCGTGGSPTCTNFLLGGQYYPGKDKKRQRREKIQKVLLLLSIPLTIIAGYMIVMIFYSLLLYSFMGTNKSSAVGSNVRDVDEQTTVVFNLEVPPSLKEATNIHLQSMESMKEDAQLLEKKWKDLLENDENSKNQLHHTDTIANTVEEDEEELEEAILQEVEEQGAFVEEESEDKTLITNPSRDGNNNQNEDSSSSAKDNDWESFINEKDVRAMRTLHNSNTHEKFSSCDPATDHDNYDVTLVIQTTHDRLQLLTETCERWPGPMVVIVYYDDSEQTNKMNPSKQWSHSCPQSHFVSYHEKEVDGKKENPYYPINKLRNLGLDHVTTSHVLVLDIDLIPSEDLYEIAKKILPKQKLQEDTNTALIVPAFERNIESTCESFEECLLYLMKDVHFLPSNIFELHDCILRKKQCNVFQSSVNWEGHSTTRSANWLQGDWYQKSLAKGDQVDHWKIDYDEPIKTVTCMDSLRYEPYMIIPWCSKRKQTSSSAHPKVVSPYYDERFHGYGKNKIQYFAHIRSMGYKFQILPKGFSVHMPHPESATKHTWNDVQKYDLHKQMDGLYLTYLHELQKKYKNSQQNLPMCKTPHN